MIEKLKFLLAGKLQRDILWNIASLGVMGISGILLNILIGIFYSPDVLGVFNQVFAAYIFFSQFAVAGVQFSVLKHVSQYSEDSRKVGELAAVGLGMTVVLAAVVTAGFWFSRELIGNLLDSPGVTVGMVWATVGLFFFALNKVLLNLLNGLRRMKLYALLQAFRPVFMVTALGVCIMSDCPGEKLALVFSVAESLLFLVLLIYALGIFRFPEWPDVCLWTKAHFNFGIKSFFSGVLIELNTRVDVLMLGYFLTDRDVGIYSLAAMIAEGLYQLPIVLRTNFNPILGQMIHAGEKDQLREFARKGRRFTYALMLGVTLFAIGGYPLAIQALGLGENYMASWPVFSILMGGIFLSSGYIPFGNILLQGGFPGWHTGMISSLVLFNIIANYFLIPVWFTLGAAAATAASFVFSLILIRTLSRRILGLSI